MLSYRELMVQFGDLVGRKPLIVSLPGLTPRLSSYWLNLVTAVPTEVARALIDGLEHDALADDAAIRALIPRALLSYREAAQRAFATEQAAAPGVSPNAPAGRWTEGSMLFRQNRPDFAFYAKHMQGEALAAAAVDAVWEQVVSIGGEAGYYFLDPLWKLRGRLDQWSGGTGLTRGRRHPRNLAVGDALDFWRVVGLEPQRRLTLLAEMKLPGSAALEFELQGCEDGWTRIQVTATFHPAGAPGLLYWHALAPAHAVIFSGLARAIAARAELAAPHRPTSQGRP